MKKFVIAALLALVPCSVLAEYPDSPITIVVPFAAGSQIDRLTRDLAQAMKKSMGNQPILVENIQGDGGAVGTNKVAKASPDGYTLLIQSLSMAARPGLKLSTPYSVLDDFEYLGMFAEVPMALVGRPTLPAATYAELTKWLEANKGKINIGNGGLGGTSHLCGQLFQSMTKIDMSHVPYKGTAPAISDLMAGQLDLMCELTSVVAGQIRAGKVKAYAVTMGKRLTTPGLEALPTLDEAGLKGFRASGWQALYAPKGTPTSITNKLNAALRAVTTDPDFVESAEKIGAVMVTDARLSGVEHKRFVQAEIAKWDQVINATGQYADSGRSTAATTARPSVPAMTGTAPVNPKTDGAGEFSSRYSFGTRGFKPMNREECLTVRGNISRHFTVKMNTSYDEYKYLYEQMVGEADAVIALYSGPCAGNVDSKGMIDYGHNIKRQAAELYRRGTSQSPPSPPSDDRPCSQRMPWLPAHTCQ